MPLSHPDPALQARLQAALAPRFSIERELGGGGMSRVFVATEGALGRRVVIKVLPPELAAGVNLERFHREIQLAAQLQHPHIVPLLATGEVDGLLWFSMPFIDGESLRAPLARGERLPARDVVPLVRDILEALAYAHARGVVHRDIKPGNILTQGRSALVTDFGVAKALSAAAPAPGATATGMAIGTPAYMAPEQLAADPAADHRVDLYAVGLVAYELLTGAPPFGGRTPQETLAAQLTVVPTPPHRVHADIPPALSALVMQCLEKEAERRPATAADLLAALEARPVLAMGPSGPQALRRARGWAAAIAIVGVGYLAMQLARPTARRAPDAAPDAAPATTPPAAPAQASGPAAPAADASQSLRAETVVVLAEPGDRGGATQVPVVISRAESLAIAAAVRQRAVPPAAPAAALPAVVALDRAQLLEEVGKLLADSLAQALRRAGMDTASQRATRALPADTGTARRRITPLIGPQADGRRRLVVLPYTNATGQRALSALGRDLAAALRAGVPAEQVMVVDSAMTAAAARERRDPMAVGWSLRADYVVSGMVIAHGDSVGLLTQFTDVRDGRFVRAAEELVAPAAPAAGYAASVVRLRAWMDSAAALRARRPAGTGRGNGSGRGTRG